MKSEMYTATQGLVARQFQLDAVANNIANVNTTGFRETSPFFRSFNRAVEDGPVNTMNYNANGQPVAAGIFAHSKQGALRETGNTFDMALSGEGYFKIDTPNGVRYTRNGNFTLRPLQGNTTSAELITTRGNRVLNTNGQPIVLQINAQNTHINREGVVVQDGANRGQIALVDFADKTALTPEEDTLLVMQDPNAQEQAAPGQLQTGFLEASNVNIAEQMINMIQAQRAYETNIRTIRTIDTGMNQTVIQGFGPR